MTWNHHYQLVKEGEQTILFHGGLRMTCKFEEKKNQVIRMENYWTDQHTIWTKTIQSDNFFHFQKLHSWVYSQCHADLIITTAPGDRNTTARHIIGKIVNLESSGPTSNAKGYNRNFCNIYLFVSAVLILPFSLMISHK